MISATSGYIPDLNHISELFFKKKINTNNKKEIMGGDFIFKEKKMLEVMQKQLSLSSPGRCVINTVIR